MIVDDLRQDGTTACVREMLKMEVKTGRQLSWESLL